MAQPGTPLTDGQLANFIAALTRAGILIAPQLGVVAVLRWSKANDELLQRKLVEALSYPAFSRKPQQLNLMVQWQIGNEFSHEVERFLRSLGTDEKRFKITGFGRRLLDLALSLPRSTGRTEYLVCTPRQFGVRHSEYYHQLVFWMMEKYGLGLCSKLAGPIICALTPCSDVAPSLFVAMQPLSYRRDIELTFKLSCNDGKRVLDARPVKNLVIDPDDPLLFALRPD